MGQPATGWFWLAQFLLHQLNGYFLHRFLDISRREYVPPPDFPDSIAEKGGMSGTLLTHHSMKFAAHPFPAPRRPLLEAEQSFWECFLSWHVLPSFQQSTDTVPAHIEGYGSGKTHGNRIGIL